MDIDKSGFPNIGNSKFYSNEFSVGQMLPQIPLTGSKEDINHYNGDILDELVRDEEEFEKVPVFESGNDSQTRFDIFYDNLRANILAKYDVDIIRRVYYNSKYNMMYQTFTDKDKLRNDIENPSELINRDLYVFSDIHVGKFPEEDNNLLLWINQIPEDSNMLILGDIIYAKDLKPDVVKKFFDKVKCQNRYMLLGNHDVLDLNYYYDELKFKGIYTEIEDKKHKLLFTHQPVSCKPDWINIHGHLHDDTNYHESLKYLDKKINVYYKFYDEPKTLEEILRMRFKHAENIKESVDNYVMEDGHSKKMKARHNLKKKHVEQRFDKQMNFNKTGIDNHGNVTGTVKIGDGPTVSMVKTNKGVNSNYNPLKQKITMDKKSIRSKGSDVAGTHEYSHAMDDNNGIHDIRQKSDSLKEKYSNKNYKTKRKIDDIIRKKENRELSKRKHDIDSKNNFDKDFTKLKIREKNKGNGLNEHDRQPNEARADVVAILNTKGKNNANRHKKFVNSLASRKEQSTKDFSTRRMYWARNEDGSLPDDVKKTLKNEDIKMKKKLDNIKKSNFTRSKINQELANKHKSNFTLNESCKDLASAREFVSEVGKLAKKYDANYFIVTDGASGIHNNGNPAVKHARDMQKEWERKNGFDPDEDWEKDKKGNKKNMNESFDIANSLFDELFNENTTTKGGDPKIPDQIEGTVNILEGKGYQVKYASPGYTNTKFGNDKNKDNIVYNKLVSTGRIIFSRDYKFTSTPKGWEWKALQNGSKALYVKPLTYDGKEPDTDKAFQKWKGDYMDALKKWAIALPTCGTES